MMDIRPLNTEADYDWALSEIATYFEHEPEPETPDAARFDVLAALIGRYEDQHWPIEAPDAVEAIRERMDAAGYAQADLARVLGSRSRASEILSRRRGLTLDQAYRLNRDWHIPAEILIRPYHAG
jgi:HTH-type transcriptional regulator/antitoxin HigA